MARILVSDFSREEGGLFLIDTKTGRHERVWDQQTRGMTFGPDGLYAVSTEGVIHRLDPRSWKPTLRLETGIHGCHDLKWYDGHFYLVACPGNRIVKLAPDLTVVDELQVVQHEKADADVCHPNCLEMVNGHMLLSIFTLSPGTRREKNMLPEWRTEGKVLRLDWETKSYEILFEPLCQPHSLTWHDDQLFCCESFTSEVSAISLEKKAKRRMAKLRGFVRGIVFVDGRAYVGVSLRKTTFLPPLQAWLERRFRWSGVVEFDARSWKVKRRFPLPGTALYEMLLLDGPEGGR